MIGEGPRPGLSQQELDRLQSLDSRKNLATPRTRGARVTAWLEDRLGLAQLGRTIAGGSVPGGASLWHTLGSVAAALVLLEMATGVFLAASYVPSVAGAWASVAYVQDQVTLGWFVRGLHSFGSSALLVVTGLHLLQVLLFGAYKAPREANWVAGLALLGLTVAFALTGSFLPYDQKGYWAKIVEASIAGGTPAIGPVAQHLLQGGAAFGTLTLTRVFAAHALVLPAALSLVLVLHVYLHRRHGATPRWSLTERQAADRATPFWPDQAARNALVSAGAFLAVVVAVVASHGADLGSPADPTSSYVARPEWYALPLFQLRLLFEGPLEPVATLLLPALLVGLLLALPFLDRAPTRAPGRRARIMAGAGVGLLAAGLLTGLALRQDARDPALARARAVERDKAGTARRLALQGVPPEGGLAVFRNDPLFAARELWDDKCAGCHALDGNGGEKGPDFKGYNTRGWIRGFLQNPQGKRYMGPAKVDKPMEPVEATPDELDALTEFIYAQTGATDVDRARAARGQALFPEMDCDTCHELDGVGENAGPNLKGRGTPAWLVDVIANAGAGHLYGEKNKMTKFANKLTPAEMAGLARFVASQKDSPAAR